MQTNVVVDLYVAVATAVAEGKLRTKATIHMDNSACVIYDYSVKG